MEYRLLGNTGLKVSEIGLGCEGFLEDNYAYCNSLLEKALECGVNYVDLYSPDPNLRKIVGKTIKPNRDKFVLQAHLCSVWKNNQYLRTRELSEVKAGFEKMLTDLDTFYVDIGMIHYCDSIKDWTDIAENGILDYAKYLKTKGRIHHIGISSHNPQVAMAAINSGFIQVLMFSINPCYDLLPASEIVEELFEEDTYKGHFENMDPERQALYEACQKKGIGITVMKAFAGGDLLKENNSLTGVALTVPQLLHYCLTRPGVATVCCGAHNLKQFEDCLKYQSATKEEKDYASKLASFKNVTWQGHCMYCNHCLPCSAQVNIAEVTKYLHLALAQGGIVETVREHYKLLDHHALDCIQCGLCETRCPFGVKIIDNMNKAASVFGY